MSQKWLAGIVSYNAPSRPLIKLPAVTDRVRMPYIRPRVGSGARVRTSVVETGEK